VLGYDEADVGEPVLHADEARREKGEDGERRESAHELQPFDRLRERQRIRAPSLGHGLSPLHRSSRTRFGV